MSFRQQEAVQPQPALDLLTAISGTKSLSMLDGFCRALWIDWGEGRFSDEQAQSLSEAIEARRREVRGIDRLAVRAPQVAAQARAAGRPSHFPPKRKAARSPNRRASIERRRTLGGVRPDAAAARQPVHDRRAGGVADRRRRRAGPGRLHPDLGRDRGAGREYASPRPGTRCGRPRARGSSPSRSVGATSGRTSPMWCGWCRGNGRRGSSAAPKERRKAAPARPRGEGAKKQGPRIKILSKSYAETAFHAVNFPKMPFARRQTASCCGHRLYAASPRRGFSMKSGAARFGKTNSGEEA